MNSSEQVPNVLNATHEDVQDEGETIHHEIIQADKTPKKKDEGPPLPCEVFSNKLGKQYKFELRSNHEVMEKAQTIEVEKIELVPTNTIQETERQKQRRLKVENFLKDPFKNEEIQKIKCWQDHVLQIKAIDAQMEEKNCKDCQQNFKADDKHCLHCDECFKNGYNSSRCKKCVIKDHDLVKFPEVLKKIGFSKDPLQMMYSRGEKWVCGSSYMKGNNVPDEYCICLLGIDSQLSQKDYEMRSFNSFFYVKIKNSEVRFCGACYNLWKDYEFDESKDYTKFSIPKFKFKVDKEKKVEDQEKGKNQKKQANQIKLFKKPAEGNKKKKDEKNYSFQRMESLDSGSGVNGSKMLEMITDKFAQESLPQLLTQTQFSIQGFTIDMDKHKQNFSPEIQGLLHLVNDTSIVTYGNTDMKICQFGEDYRIIVAAHEYISFENHPKISAKTLRIYNPSNDFKESDCILLETFDEERDYSVPTDKFASYLHHKNFIFYFKRIFTGSAKTSGFKPKDESMVIKTANFEMSKAKRVIGDNEMIESEKEDVEDDQMAKIKQNEVFSFLQLFMYDLETFQEKPVSNYVITEDFGFYSVRFNKCFGSTYMLQSSNDQINRKIFSKLEDAISFSQDAYKKDGVSSRVIDINKKECVFRAGEFPYWMKYSISSDGNIIDSDNIAYSFSSYPDKIEEPVTKETIDNLSLGYLWDLFNSNYFLLYKASDFAPDQALLETIKLKCNNDYCSKKGEVMQYMKTDYREYCYTCGQYSFYSVRCEGGCYTRKCHKCLLKESGHEPKTEKKTLKDYNFIYRMNDPKHFVKYYQPSSSSKQTPLMFWKCNEAVNGQFSEMHKFPHLKMNNKADFKLPKKEEGKETKPTVKETDQVSIAQNNQEKTGINKRTLFVIWEDTQSALTTYLYPNEEITEAPHEVKKREHDEGLLKEKEVDKKDPATVASPKPKTEETKEAPKVEEYKELTLEEKRPLELKHQGFISKNYIGEETGITSIETWGVTIQNVMLPNQDETCTYIQYAFQRTNGTISLLYPLFDDTKEKLDAGEGDCTASQTYTEYLRVKADKQKNDFTLTQAIQYNNTAISAKLQQQLGIYNYSDYEPAEIEYFQSNRHQDLIWSTSQETFTIKVLQIDLQNEILTTQSFYKKPQIGMKTNESVEKFNDNVQFQMMSDRMNSWQNKGETHYLNSVYRNLIYTNNQVFFTLKNENNEDVSVEENLGFEANQAHLTYVEGENGSLVALPLYEIDLKNKEHDLKTLLSSIEIVFIAKQKDSVWFVLLVKNLFYMLVQKPLSFIKQKQKEAILTIKSEVHVFENINNQDVCLRRFKIKEFTELKKDQLERFQYNSFVFEEWVDNSFNFTTLTMVYQRQKDNKKECLSILTVDLNSVDKEKPMKTYLFKMQVKNKLNETIFMDDIKLQRTRQPELSSDKKETKTEFAMLILEKYTACQQILYEIQMSEKREHQETNQIMVFVKRKSLILSSPLLQTSEFNGYSPKLDNNCLFPIYDKFQDKQEGYLIFNKQYYYTTFNHVIARFKDSDVLPKYESDTMNLDCRKIYFKGFDSNEFWLYLDAKFKPELIDLHVFDVFDQKHLLDHALYSMLNMVEFNFKNYLIQDNMTDIQKTNIFKKREELFGITLSEIFVKDPQLISEALAIKTQENIYDYSIAENMYRFSKNDELALFKAFDHFKGDSIFYLQSNFNQENLLIRAANEKSFKTAGLIIDHIFGLEGRNIYQVEIMKALPVILGSEKLANKIIKFFDLPNFEDKKDNHLSFEQRLDEEDNPLFSTEQWFVHETQAYDYSNYQAELVAQLNDIAEKRNQEFEAKLKKKRKAVGGEEEATQTLYDVQNTFVDFRAMICAQKFQEFKKNGQYTFKFDNYSLSSMVEQMSSNQLFYNCVSVQRLIDHQYSKSKGNLFFQILLFLGGYYILFLSTLFEWAQPQDQQNNMNKVNLGIVMTVCLITLCYFFLIELIQIRMNGIVDYVLGSGIWNFFDFTQFTIFLILYILNANDGFDGLGYEKGQSVSDAKQKSLYPIVIILQTYLILTGFVKILFYMRLDKTYGQLVMMVQSTFSQVGPFIIFFILWVIFFAFQYFNLKVDIDNVEEDYDSLNTFITYIIMTYRDSIGDITRPGYKGIWQPKLQNEHEAVMYIIWIVWLFNQFMCLIVLLNFLIAVISGVYEEVVKDKDAILNMNRAGLNREYFQIQRFFNLGKEFGVLVYQIEVKDQTEENKESFQDFVQIIKSFISKQNTDLSLKIDDISHQMLETQAKMAAMQKQLTNVVEPVQQMKKDMLTQHNQIMLHLTNLKSGEQIDASQMWNKAAQEAVKQ